MIPHNDYTAITFIAILVVSCFILYWLFFHYKPKMDAEVIAWHVRADYEELVEKVRLTHDAHELNELYQSDVKLFINAFTNTTNFAKMKTDLYAEVYNKRMQFNEWYPDTTMI